MILVNKRIGGGYGLGVTLMANKLLAVSAFRYRVVCYTGTQHNRAGEKQNCTQVVIPVMRTAGHSGLTLRQ